MFGIRWRPSDAEIREQAAVRAVVGVPEEIKALGGSQEQAEAVSEALRLILLADDHERRAREALSRADFNASQVEQIIASIRSGCM